MKQDNVINLKIHSRKGITFSGSVSSLSSVNARGKFDILPMHSNFISLIQERVVYRDAVSAVEHVIPISQAVLRASQNEVNIYLGLSMQ